MTEPAAAPPNDTPRPKGRRRVQSWTLALILSLVLFTGWATFLTLAPTPEVAPLPVIPVAEAPSPVVKPANEVRLLAWRNAIDADVLAGFAADSGVKVVVDGFDTTEALQALIDAGGVTQDVVLVSGVGLKALADKDLLRPLARGDLLNARNIDPALTARTAIYDANNDHGVPILWGTIGLSFNAAKIAERLGEDAPSDSWALLFDPANAAKLKDCGIQVIDSPTGVFPIALTHLGLSATSAQAEDTDAAARVWESVRPSIAKFSSADIVDNLASGAVCLAVTTSGDAYQARGKARTAGLAHDIRYVLPKEGTVAWYDMLAVTRTTENAANALRFIDYLLRPEVAARMTNSKGFGNAVQGAALYVKPEIKADPALVPDLAALKAVDEVAPPPDVQALRNRFWKLINATAEPPAPPPAEKPAQ